MAQIMSIAQSLGGGQAENTSQPVPQPQQDDGFARAILQIMQQAQHTDSRQEALLCALKPYVVPERRDKIDRALRIARLAQLAGCALRSYGGGLLEK